MLAADPQAAITRAVVAHHLDSISEPPGLSWREGMIEGDAAWSYRAWVRRLKETDRRISTRKLASRQPGILVDVHEGGAA